MLKERPACQPNGQAPPPQLQGQGECRSFDATEILCTSSFTEQVMRPNIRQAAGAAPISLDAVKVVVPGSRQITAFLCPSQLPSGSRSQTTSPNDTLTCTGGALQVGQQFTFNIRTSPNPSAGMGLQLFGRPAGGEFQGPFQLTGP